MIIGIFFSRAILSIGEITLACNFLLEGNLREKFNNLKSNRLALLLVGLFMMHILGLIFTSNFEYAFKDIRIKLPLLLFPVIFSTTKVISTRDFRYTNFFYLIITATSTIFLFSYFLLNQTEFEDIRFASFIISHVRLSLLISLAFGVSIYYFTIEKATVRAILLLYALWLFYFLLFFQMITGLAVLCLIMVVLFIRVLNSGKIKVGVKITSLLFLLGVLSALGWIASGTVNEYLENTKGDEVGNLEYTVNGNPYIHEYKTRNFALFENGNRVYQNICYSEVEREWNKRSELKVDYVDNQYRKLENILIRYLASKGKPKDSLAVTELSDKEIKAIESGIPNILYLDKSGIQVRMFVLLWELDNYFNGGNFNGHSLAMRLEYWKTCFRIFMSNFWTGVGTGDIADAYVKQYQHDNTILQPRFQLRAHNQFLTMGATFGILGLLYFLATVFVPVIKERKNLLYLCFALIYIASMLTEDTLETQIGATFYAFFNSFYLFKLEE